MYRMQMLVRHGLMRSLAWLLYSAAGAQLILVPPTVYVSIVFGTSPFPPFQQVYPPASDEACSHRRPVNADEPVYT
jgi:hypothetical protein